jgi:hypothetical protein
VVLLGGLCGWLKGAGRLTALQLGLSNVDELAPLAKLPQLQVRLKSGAIYAALPWFYFCLTNFIAGRSLVVFLLRGRWLVWLVEGCWAADCAAAGAEQSRRFGTTGQAASAAGTVGVWRDLCGTLLFAY